MTFKKKKIADENSLRVLALGILNAISRAILPFSHKNHASFGIVKLNYCKKKFAIVLQCNCSTILKQKTNILLGQFLSLSHNSLSLRLSISDSLSPFSPHSLPLFKIKTPQPPHHGPTHCHWPWQTTIHSLFLFSLSLQISVVAWRSAFGVWCNDRCLGVVWRSVLGCGFVVGCVGSNQREFLLVVVSVGFI